MGGACTQQSTKIETVTALTNSIPEDTKYRAVDSESTRFQEVTAYKSQRNEYLFTMSMRNQIDIRQCVPVLNQFIHCIGCQNYQLKLSTKMLIDIFDQKLQSTLIEAVNQKTTAEFSLKIIPFPSYTSYKFKKALYQLYLNKQLGQKSLTNVQLLDYFIYGLNTDHQAFVFLFQKSNTSLANVAEYRKQAHGHWSDKQKIKVIYEIFQSYESLFNRSIVHRDLRPSNIFYVPNSGRFVIGNFSRARLLRRKLNSASNSKMQQNDLMSVCGVPDFSCPEVQNLILSGDKVGFYEGVAQDYAGLKSILNLIETCQIYDKNPIYQDKKIAQIVTMLNQKIQFKTIKQYVDKLMQQHNINKYYEIGDREISQTCSFLLAHRHKGLIQKYLFEAYGYLGYHKNYSDKAHIILNQNNQNGKQTQNAPILKNLGDFYESKGAKGTQYYYNAFVLYILRADNQLRYGYPQKAENQLTNAQEVYFKFNKIIESDMPRIQINRVTALIQLDKNNLKDSMRLITETFMKAGKSNIPVEKQCKLLLAYGKIYKSSPNHIDDALKKLETGILICENPANFESPSVGRIYKSRFLKQIGSIYLIKLKANSVPKLNSALNQQQLQLRANAETHLRQTLQIQERQPIDDLEIADTLQELANFYYSQLNVYDAKRYYQQTKIRLAHFKQLVNPNRQLINIYMKGSCCYYLKQYNEARICYQVCLMTIKKLPITEQNEILQYNITGNHGLSLIKLGDQNGVNEVLNSLKNLQRYQGPNSYDYVALYQNYQIVYEN